MDDPDYFFRHRGRVDVSDIHRMVDQLIEYQRQTQPSQGEQSQHQKDMRSRMALILAEGLYMRLAGWAIDHQAGLAVNETRGAPLSPPGYQDDPDYRAAADQADDHRHEAAGGEYLTDIEARSPFTDRRVLARLLCLAPVQLMRELGLALQALEKGEIRPVLEPPTSHERVNAFTLWHCRRDALAHVEFRRARGSTAEAARAEVSAAFGVPPETLRSWGKEALKQLGSLAVKDALARAAVVGARCKDLGRQRFANPDAAAEMAQMRRHFDDDALIKDGRRYQDEMRRAEEKRVKRQR